MSLQALYKNGCLNSVDGLYLPCLPWPCPALDNKLFFNGTLFLFLSPIRFIQQSEGKQKVISWQQPVISVIEPAFENQVLKRGAIKWIPVVWIYQGSSQRQSPVGELYRQVYCRFKSWKRERKNKSSEKEKEADRRAVWRIGAPSDCVEKSFHLNAPLHPNNSSAAGKKTPCALPFPSFLCFTLLSEQLWRAPGCYPSGCLCARLMWVYAKRGLAVGLRGWLL